MKAKISQKKLEKMSDEEVLSLRFSQLPVAVSDCEHESIIKETLAELNAMGLTFKVRLYVGDEWISPDASSAVSLPFYLMHPRLKALERKMMMDVEGESKDEFRKLFRHELGHCFDHAFALSRKKAWQNHFGKPNKDYNPETYRPRPYSRSYVKHLDNWYAQAHPLEDFAESFAVYLKGKDLWEHDYARCPQVLKKLNYIDHLVKGHRFKEARHDTPYLPSRVANLQTRLSKHYEKCRLLYQEKYPDFYDKDLESIFVRTIELNAKSTLAAQFLRKNRKRLVQSVSYWSGERKFTVDSLLRKLISRAEKLGLQLPNDQEQCFMELSSYLSTLVVHYLFTGKFKRRV